LTLGRELHKLRTAKGKYMPDETHELPSLDELERKIEKAKPKAEKESGGMGSDYSQAFRYTVDLSAGVLVGALVGVGFDYLVGSLPWATIVCIFLGMGAGIRNMMRSAAEIERKTSE